MIRSQSLTKTAQHSDILKETGAVVMNGFRRLSARRTWLKSGSALMAVVLTEDGGSIGVSAMPQGLLSLICVLTGTIGDEESTSKSGFLTSPNFPDYYPNSHDSTQTIQVAEGKIIKITFTDFTRNRVVTLSRSWMEMGQASLPSLSVTLSSQALATALHLIGYPRITTASATAPPLPATQTLCMSSSTRTTLTRSRA